jgi:dienelactone hydrolase
MLLLALGALLVGCGSGAAHGGAAADTAAPVDLAADLAVGTDTAAPADLTADLSAGTDTAAPADAPADTGDPPAEEDVSPARDALPAGDTPTVADAAAAADGSADGGPGGDTAGGCLAAAATPAELYDLAALRDPATLDLEILRSWNDGFPSVRVFEVRYTSYQVDGCAQSPVRIEAYVALPLRSVGAADSLPGLIVAHGLGGSADAGAAAGPARALGVVALAYSGPGQGASEGRGSDPDHLFDTRTDPRASWFWEHAVAAMRGLTVLEQWPEVDATRLAMVGYSGGAVATLMVNGLDSRLDAAAPVSGTGHLDRAARATPTPGWEAQLLHAMTPPRTPDSPEWAEYVRWLDPANYLGTAHGAVFLIDGAQDQFFPLTSLTATFDDLVAGGGTHRLLAIKDWDHGVLAVLNEEGGRIATDALRYWLRHQLGLGGATDGLVPQPRVDALVPWTCVDPATPPFVWDCAAVQASLDAPSPYTVSDVRLHWTADALTILSWNLREDNGVWRAEVGGLDGRTADGLVYWVEFGFRIGLSGPVVRVSSRPHLPAGFVPNILPMP